MIPYHTWVKSDYINAEDFNRIASNAYVVSKTFQKYGYINRIRNLNCDYDDTQLNVTFDNGWLALREQIWELWNLFPFSEIFPNTLYYREPLIPSSSKQTEELTDELLNSMELNLYLMNVFITNFDERFDRLPVKMTENKLYRKYVKRKV